MIHDAQISEWRIFFYLTLKMEFLDFDFITSWIWFRSLLLLRYSFSSCFVHLCQTWAGYSIRCWLVGVLALWLVRIGQLVFVMCLPSRSERTPLLSNLESLTLPILHGNSVIFDWKNNHQPGLFLFFDVNKIVWINVVYNKKWIIIAPLVPLIFLFYV